MGKRKKAEGNTSTNDIDKKSEAKSKIGKSNKKEHTELQTQLLSEVKESNQKLFIIISDGNIHNKVYNRIKSKSSTKNAKSPIKRNYYISKRSINEKAIEFFKYCKEQGFYVIVLYKLYMLTNSETANKIAANIRELSGNDKIIIASNTKVASERCPEYHLKNNILNYIPKEALLIYLRPESRIKELVAQSLSVQELSEQFGHVKGIDIEKFGKNTFQNISKIYQDYLNQLNSVAMEKEEIVDPIVAAIQHSSEHLEEEANKHIPSILNFNYQQLFIDSIISQFSEMSEIPEELVYYFGQSGEVEHNWQNYISEETEVSNALVGSK